MKIFSKKFSKSSLKINLKSIFIKYCSSSLIRQKIKQQFINIVFFLLAASRHVMKCGMKEKKKQNIYKIKMKFSADFGVASGIKM